MIFVYSRSIQLLYGNMGSEWLWSGQNLIRWCILFYHNIFKWSLPVYIRSIYNIRIEKNSSKRCNVLADIAFSNKAGAYPVVSIHRHFILVYSVLMLSLACAHFLGSSLMLMRSVNWTQRYPPFTMWTMERRRPASTSLVNMFAFRSTCSHGSILKGRPLRVQFPRYQASIRIR